MKKIFSFLLLFSLAFPLWASIIIKGSIVDAADQSPLDYVNITLFKQGSQKPITLVSSETNGTFIFSGVENGKYTIRLSYVGFNTVNQVVEVNGQPVNLGVIKMNADSKNLGEVEVVGQGSQMRFDIDKKVFSVDQNIASSGGSATDVLKNIPSVSVDNEGNVSLRKDGNVEIWINGKASGLTADNRAQVLQQLPAESIESIELMTNPSAKYNPEGSAGIINLVLKKERKAGYYGSVSAGLIYPDGGKLGQNLGANINYSSSKFDAYINLGYRAMDFQGGGFTNRYNKNKAGIDSTLISQNNSMDNSFGGLFLRAGIDFRLNSKNTLGISGFGMAGTGNSTNTINYKQFDLLTNTTQRDYSKINTGTGNRPSMNMNLDYSHEFDKKGNTFMATLSYSNHVRGGDNRFEQSDLISPLNDITQSSTDKNNEIMLKGDYTNKLTETSKLELGWQNTISNRLSDASGLYTQTRVMLPAYKNIFNYDEQIHAAYITYGNKFGRFSIQGGLRGEYFWKQSTNTTSDGPQTIPSKTVIQLFPSMYLSYELKNKDEIQLNYSRRINRPRGRQINPFRDYSDSTNISYGNPDLSPEYSSAIELNYLKNWENQMLSASIYYHNTTNVIEHVSFLNAGTMENTYMNLSKSQNTGMELVSKNRIFTILNLTTSVNMYYNKLEASVYQNPYNLNLTTSIPEQSNFSWSANMLANFLLSKTLSGQITGEYESPELVAQGSQAAKYSIDLGLRKTFMDRKLSVSLMARDILNSNQHSSTTSGAGFSQTSETFFHGRMYGVTLSYNFGNMKPKVVDMKKKEGTQDMNMEGGGEQL